MTVVDPAVGIILVAAGITLLGLELVHPGALLLIPGSILIAAGFLYLYLPNALLDSYVGPFVIVVVAILAAFIEIPYYRWVAPPKPPYSSTPAGMVGEEAIVTAPVVPHTLRGKVRVRSEIWSARADVPIPAGTKVRIVQGEGVSVTVEPLERPPPS